MPNGTRYLLALVGVLAVALVPAAASAERAATPSWVTTAKQRLAKLDTTAAASMTGYARAKFGPAWFDVDLNGCDTRNDILARDLRQVTFKTGDDCVVARGTLRDRYTATTINFVRWTADKRLFFANDALELLAVDGPTNSAKGGKDAADWLPPNTAFRCRYVARQIAIKTKYDLWVSQAERTAMTGVLNNC